MCRRTGIRIVSNIWFKWIEFVSLLDKGEGNFPCYYNINDLERGSDKDKSKLVAPLDPNHTHFILVDDGSRKVFGREIGFRTAFERHIKSLKNQEGRIWKQALTNNTHTHIWHTSWNVIYIADIWYDESLFSDKAKCWITVLVKVTVSDFPTFQNLLSTTLLLHPWKC